MGAEQAAAMFEESRPTTQIASELVSGSLVYRYDPEASPGGLRGQKSIFAMCTFWYVEALARSDASTTPG